MLNINIYIKYSLIYKCYTIIIQEKREWTKKRNKIFVLLKICSINEIQDSILAILKNDKLEENIIAKFSFFKF